jgi:hypothetical protein
MWDLAREKNSLESLAIVGDSPVFEISIGLRMFLSSTRHVKPGVNLRRPRRKAKYYVSTDSELVP